MRQGLFRKKLTLIFWICLITFQGLLSQDKLAEIAQIKMKALNTTDIEQAKRVIAGTANSMGIEIEG